MTRYLSESSSTLIGWLGACCAVIGSSKKEWSRPPPSGMNSSTLTTEESWRLLSERASVTDAGNERDRGEII